MTQLTGLSLAIAVAISVAYVLGTAAYSVAVWLHGVNGKAGKVASISLIIVGAAALIGAATVWEWAGAVLVVAFVGAIISVMVWVAWE